MDKDEILEKVYFMLSRQRFAVWYSDDGAFGKHIMGDDGAVSKEQIKHDIAQMLGL